jgi:hypothetical protein
MKEPTDKTGKAGQSQDWLAAKVLSSLKGIRYGSVVLTVHDSRVVQIERVERSRLDDLNSVEKGGGI